MLTLYRPESIFSPRHIPSWLLFTFAAGAVNAAALLACQTYVTHVTGTVTRLGMEVVHLMPLLDFALVLSCFIGGAMLSGLLINGRAHQNKRPRFSVPLWISFSLVLFTAIAGHFGLLGVFGGPVIVPADFILLSILSFAMGLQNAAIATSTGLLVRTTHLTGPATDLGIHLAELMFSKDEALALAKRHAALRAGKIAAFAAGAAVTVPIAHRVEFLVFLMPASLMLLAIILSFLPENMRQEARARIEEMRHASRQRTGADVPGPVPAE
ncbi:YoaK family protein [Nannocystis bainbridge]|uniref:YoaK family protein n=1 Tax=Nannocystis bainbridge TaxID=2995303 RepID=A0ABT5E242_9BACT|nr:YoaK family protein [Nannocystis bainbridge]MDC0719028.1 YoaK family protein [Nannocystis bainbridge]